MIKIKYPKINEQIIQHKAFVNKIVEMLQTIKEGNISEKMNNFLTNWLIKHILGYDKELGKYYNIVSR
jgi:hemerythrin-like metal-binding protein